MTQKMSFFERYPWFDELNLKLQKMEELLLEDEDEDEDEDNKCFYNIFSNHVITMKQIRSLMNNETFKSSDDMNCYMINTDMIGVSWYSYADLFIDEYAIDDIWEDIDGQAWTRSNCFLRPTKKLLKDVNKYLEKKNAL
jgi:hypothetical protein